MYLRHGDISWDHQDGSDAGAVAALATTATHLSGRRRNRASAAASSRLPFIELYDVKLHQVTEEQCVQFILGELEAGHGGVVVTPNLDHLRRCVRDLHFGALVAEADLVVADGMPHGVGQPVAGNPPARAGCGFQFDFQFDQGRGRKRTVGFPSGRCRGDRQGSGGDSPKAAPRIENRRYFLPAAGV